MPPYRSINGQFLDGCNLTIKIKSQKENQKKIQLKTFKQVAKCK